jgi:16S rRNA (adenine1518-N6/adenine1519-N6)-dimethyltransferase
VDSAVLHLVPRPQPMVAPDRIPAFRRLVTGVFSYRRKRMHRALREARGVSAEDASTILARAGIDPDVRPEVVDVPAWVRLLDAVEGS